MLSFYTVFSSLLRRFLCALCSPCDRVGLRVGFACSTCDCGGFPLSALGIPQIPKTCGLILICPLKIVPMGVGEMESLGGVDENVGEVINAGLIYVGGYGWHIFSGMDLIP